MMRNAINAAPKMTTMDEIGTKRLASLRLSAL